MGEVAKAGVCPKCGGTDTCVDVRRKGKGVKPQQYVAFGRCHSCGYDDLKYFGDDVDLLTHVAGSSFSTVYVGDSDNVEGVPSLDVIASEFAMLAKALCLHIEDCCKCPLHEPVDPPVKQGDEGYVKVNSKIGLSCRSQQVDDCYKDLGRKFPGLKPEF